MLQWFLVNDAGQNALNSLAGAKFHFFSFSDDFDESFCKVYIVNRVGPDWSTYGELTIASFAALWHCNSREGYAHIDFNLNIFFLLQLLSQLMNRLLLLVGIFGWLSTSFLFVFLVLPCLNISFNDLFNLTALRLEPIRFAINTLVHLRILEN